MFHVFYQYRQVLSRYGVSLLISLYQCEATVVTYKGDILMLLSPEGSFSCLYLYKISIYLLNYCSIYFSIYIYRELYINIC